MAVVAQWKNDTFATPLCDPISFHPTLHSALSDVPFDCLCLTLERDCGIDEFEFENDGTTCVDCEEDQPYGFIVGIGIPTLYPTEMGSCIYRDEYPGEYSWQLNIATGVLTYTDEMDVTYTWNLISGEWQCTNTNIVHSQDPPDGYETYYCVTPFDGAFAEVTGTLPTVRVAGIFKGGSELDSTSAEPYPVMADTIDNAFAEFNANSYVYGGAAVNSHAGAGWEGKDVEQINNVLAYANFTKTVGFISLQLNGGSLRDFAPLDVPQLFLGFPIQYGYPANYTGGETPNTDTNYSYTPDKTAITWTWGMVASANAGTPVTGMPNGSTVYGDEGDAVCPNNLGAWQVIVPSFSTVILASGGPQNLSYSVTRMVYLNLTPLLDETGDFLIIRGWMDDPAEIAEPPNGDDDVSDSISGARTGTLSPGVMLFYVPDL